MDFIKLNANSNKELIDKVYEIIKEAGRYLLEKYDLNHWSTPYPRESIEHDIKTKSVYIVKHEKEYVATFTISDKSDYFDNNQSIYISKFATHPKHMGHGYGGSCINFIRKLAISSENIRYIRCEVYNKSKESETFYINKGFQIIGEKPTRRFVVDLLEYNVQPRVLIVGAGFLQKYIIEKVNELGYISIAIDGNPDAPGLKIADYSKVIDIKDEAACLKYAEEMHIDAVLTGATDYGVLSVSYIAEKLKLNGINYQTAKLVKNKFEVQNLLYKKKINKQKYYFIKDLTELERIKDEIQFPIFVKPTDGSGSRGVNKSDNYLSLIDHVKKALEASISNSCILEPFHEGEEYGVESFVYKENIYVLITMRKKMTDPPYFAELGHSVIVEKEIECDIEKKVRDIIKALNIDFGSVNMDLIVNEKGIHLIDIGVRMGGNLIGSHIIPLSTGVDYMKWMIEGALNKPINLKKEYIKFVSSRLITFDTGIIEYINHNEINDIDCLYKLININRGSYVHAYRNNPDGCGYVICEGNTYEDSMSKVDTALERVKKCITMKGIKENV